MARLVRSYELPAELEIEWSKYLTENRLNPNAVIETMISERLRAVKKENSHSTNKK